MIVTLLFSTAVALVAGVLARAVVDLSAGNSPAQLVALALLLAVAFLLVAFVLREKRVSLEIPLFLAGTFLIDAASLSVYRYFLLSDLLILLALAVLWRRCGRSVLVLPFAVMPLFLLFLIAHLVSMTRASSPSLGLSTWAHMVYMMLALVPAVATVVKYRPALRIPIFFTLLCAAVAHAAAIDWLVWNGLEWRTGSRISGFGGVWLLACGYVGLVGLVLRSNLGGRVAAVACLAVLTPAVLFLRSRMLWVAILAGCGSFLFLQIRPWWRAAVLASGTTALLLLGYGAGLLPAAIQARVEATLAPSRSVDLVYRIEAIRRLAKPFEASPFIGIGIGQSASYLPPAFVLGNVGAVHNVVLNAAVEGGTVAGLAALLLPLGVFAMWLRAIRATEMGTHDWFLANWTFASFMGIYAGVQFTPALYEHLGYYLIGFLGGLALMGRAKVART